jgi:hypothetical protein
MATTVCECACVRLYVICLILSLTLCATDCHSSILSPNFALPVAAPIIAFNSPCPSSKYHTLFLYCWAPTFFTYVTSSCLQCFLNFSSLQLASNPLNPSTQYVMAALRVVAGDWLPTVPKNLSPLVPTSTH